MNIFTRIDLPKNFRIIRLVLIGAFTCLCQNTDYPVHIKKIGAGLGQSGTVLEIECLLDIIPPWHIKSDFAKSSTLIATGISLADSNLGIQAEKAYPPADTLIFSGTVLEVFSGLISFKESFKLYEKAVFPLDAVLQYQACGNGMCLPPQYLQIRISETGEVLQSGDSAQSSRER